jgi:hypothetical protein
VYIRLYDALMTVSLIQSTKAKVIASFMRFKKRTQYGLWSNTTLRLRTENTNTLQREFTLKQVSLSCRFRSSTTVMSSTADALILQGLCYPLKLPSMDISSI